MNIIRRILSLASSRSGGRAAASRPAGRGGRGRRRGAQPKPTGLAALRGMLRR